MNSDSYKCVRLSNEVISHSNKSISVDKVIDILSTQLNLKNVCQILCDKSKESVNLFFSAENNAGKKFFIKCGNVFELYINEYLRQKEVYNIDSRHFIEPVYYAIIENLGISVSNYICGEHLSNTSLNIEQKKIFLEDIYEISKALYDAGVSHRDIRPENFIIHDGHLILIDFQLSVSLKEYKELKYLEGNIKQLIHLGEPFAMGKLKWSDSYSLLKLLEFIGVEEQYKERYEYIYNQIKNSIKTDTISLKPKLDFKFLKYFIEYKYLK